MDGDVNDFIYIKYNYICSWPIASNIGRQISRIKMGIVFHTKYTGKTLDSMTVGFGDS